MSFETKLVVSRSSAVSLFSYLSPVSTSRCAQSGVLRAEENVRFRTKRRGAVCREQQFPFGRCLK